MAAQSMEETAQDAVTGDSGEKEGKGQWRETVGRGEGGAQDGAKGGTRKPNSGR